MSLSKKPHVLIVGCGDIGTRLGLSLVAAGWRVTGLRRVAEKLPASFDRLSADIFNLSIAPELMRSIDVVVYSVTPSSGGAEQYQRAYVEGVASVLAAIAENPPKLWLHFSSSRAWSVDDGSWVDELTITPAKDSQTQSLLDGEQLVVDSDIPSVITRFSGIYGKNHDAIERMLRRWAGYSPTSLAWTNRIHADDAAGFCAYLLRQWLSGKQPSQLYAVSDDYPATQAELSQWSTSSELVTSCSESSSYASVIEGESLMRGKRIANKRLRESGYRLKYSRVFNALTD